MSQIEKQLNKVDLKAWKECDNQQYCLIPGISHSKGNPKPSYQTKQNGSPGSNSGKATTLQKEQELEKRVARLADYGFNHLGHSSKVKKSPPKVTYTQPSQGLHQSTDPTFAYELDKLQPAHVGGHYEP